jgi:hypothetical protein
MANLSASLLVALALMSTYHGLVAGEEEMVVLEVEEPVASAYGADTVKTSTFSEWGYQPYYSWWPVDYCAWNFFTTGIWQITLTGGACDGSYGAKLANYARNTMLSSRGVRPFMMGVSPGTSTVMCAKGSKAGQVIYTIQVRAPNTPAGKQMMQRLRSATSGGLALARNMFTGGSMRTSGLLPGKYIDALLAGLLTAALDRLPVASLPSSRGWYWCRCMSWHSSLSKA